MTHPQWRKSSYSGQNGDCVEVACAEDRVLIRDTKNRAAGHITVNATDWRRLLATIARDCPTR